MRLTLLMMQAAVAGPPAPAPPVTRVPLTPGPACGEAAADGAIVVCGRRDQPYRLPRIAADRYAERPIRAETGLIGKARISAEADQAQMANGETAKRAMVRLKLPF